MKFNASGLKIPDCFMTDYITDDGEIAISNAFEKAVKRVRFAYEVSLSRGLGDLYVAFSGGKDSEALWIVCETARQRYGVEYSLHYNITGVDPPELYQFIKKEFPECNRHMYEKSMWQLIVEKGMPPTRLMRLCCSGLKEHGGSDKVCLTGVRWAESVRRKNQRKPYENQSSTRNEKMLFNDNDEGRLGFENCVIKRKLVCNPIIDWSDEMVWALIEENGFKYCNLYDEGETRLGCIGCPMGGTKGMLEDFKRYPNFKKLYIQAFDRMIECRRKKGLSTDWRSGEEVFEWWVNGGSQTDDGQLSFLEEEVKL